MEYPDLPYAIMPISHGEELSIPEPPEIEILAINPFQSHIGPRLTV
jgi:hypothetical protein